MIIVYIQAGSDATRVVSFTWTGHASLALTSTPTFLSYVTTPGSKYDHAQFKKGCWSNPLYRIQLTTQEDGGTSQLSEANIWNWYQRNKDDRSSLGADCVSFTRKALKAGGVLQYHKTFWTPKTPGFLGLWTASIQHQMARAGIMWPHEPDPGHNFFQQDVARGRNILPMGYSAPPNAPTGGNARGAVVAGASGDSSQTLLMAVGED